MFKKLNHNFYENIKINNAQSLFERLNNSGKKILSEESGRRPASFFGTLLSNIFEGDSVAKSKEFLRDVFTHPQTESVIKKFKEFDKFKNWDDYLLKKLSSAVSVEYQMILRDPARTFNGKTYEAMIRDTASATDGSYDAFLKDLEEGATKRLKDQEINVDPKIQPPEERLPTRDAFGDIRIPPPPGIADEAYQSFRRRVGELSEEAKSMGKNTEEQKYIDGALHDVNGYVETAMRERLPRTQLQIRNFIDGVITVAPAEMQAPLRETLHELPAYKNWQEFSVNQAREAGSLRRDMRSAARGKWSKTRWAVTVGGTAVVLTVAYFIYNLMSKKNKEQREKDMQTLKNCRDAQYTREHKEECDDAIRRNTTAKKEEDGKKEDLALADAVRLASETLNKDVPPASGEATADTVQDKNFIFTTGNRTGAIIKVNPTTYDVVFTTSSVESLPKTSGTAKEDIKEWNAILDRIYGTQQEQAKKPRKKK